MQKDASDLERLSADLKGMARLVLFNRDGEPLPMAERAHYIATIPSDEDWAIGLTAMRHAMLQDTHARIILGGQVDKYKGAMPGIAEEAVLSLRAKQPLFIMGGFGGCAKDITEALNIVESDGMQQRNWRGREEFAGFSYKDLNNGLTELENVVLAQTPHVDQAIAMILRGLFRLVKRG